MSILDVWEKKACSFTRKTRDKAVSMSEQARIRSLMAGEEKNYHSLCAQIGEKYAQVHREDYGPEFEELMTLVKESLARTQEYQDQINTLRKVRPCPNCGESVPLDFSYCNYCGAKLPEIEPIIPDGYRKCPGCGAVIPDTMAFCNRRGFKQNTQEDLVVIEEAQEPSEEAVEATGEPSDTEN